jgi:catechol 2,3-dioxygenase-like lactoylglutathione lyase family enzyme
VDLFAGFPVSDLARAQDFYERLLGAEPAFFPNDREAVWALEEHRHVYVLLDPERAGGGLVTLIVEDLEMRVEAIAGRGIVPARDETYDNGVRKVTYRDPDGNELGFGGLPA